MYKNCVDFLVFFKVEFIFFLAKLIQNFFQISSKIIICRYQKFGFVTTSAFSKFVTILQKNIIVGTVVFILKFCIRDLFDGNAQSKIRGLVAINE